MQFTLSGNLFRQLKGIPQRSLSTRSRSSKTSTLAFATQVLARTGSVAFSRALSVGHAALVVFSARTICDAKTDKIKRAIDN
jgi:hypothetical protein